MRPITLLNKNVRFIQTFASCRLQGIGQQLKEVDVVREIKAKKICGSSLDLRSGLFVVSQYLSSFRQLIRKRFSYTNVFYSYNTVM